MSEDKWVAVATITGDINAEILKGLLEAQGIPVFLSQEGVGRSIYPVTIGRLAEVEILVPDSFKSEAERVLANYQSGTYEDEANPGSSDIQDEDNQPNG